MAGNVRFVIPNDLDANHKGFVGVAGGAELG
jgi:hypothetical protein